MWKVEIVMMVVGVVVEVEVKMMDTMKMIKKMKVMMVAVVGETMTLYQAGM